ncbi:MAG: molybdopterin cofactor-binding domain-containing protein, partial [Dehalococcoidia bacterium]
MSEGVLRVVGPAGAGFPPPAASYARQAYANTQPTPELATWLELRTDGSVTAYAGKVEYGQGIRAGLAVEVAEELRVPLRAIDVILGDTDLVPWDMGTFGSQSTARVGVQLRKAAATARGALLELAVDHLDLPASELECRNGFVQTKTGDDRAVPYGALLNAGELLLEIDDGVELTPADEFSTMGAHADKIDAVDIVTGRTMYSHDVQPEHMLFAAVLRPPARGARPTDIDTSVAERMPGVEQVVSEERLVAVLADTDEHAEQALRLVQANWSESSTNASHVDVPDILLNSADEGFVTQESGSLDEGFCAADGMLEETYYAPYISNAVMEPRAAVAQWEDGRLTVWAGTQRPFGIRTELAQHFDIDEGSVRVIAPQIGGGFGSKSPYSVALEAARLAKIAGRPVRVAYTRAEEMQYATFRPAALIHIKSGFTKDGTIIAWECKAYHAGDRPFIGRRGSQTP